MIKIICDKCGGSNITDTILNPPAVHDERVKMSEYRGFGAGISVQAVMRYYQHKLFCKDCGFTTEYTA